MTAALPHDALPWSAAEFEARLRALESRYHIHHPFNRRLNSGALAPFQVRGWVANRFYYQHAIPMKDAAIMANCEDRATRRRWALRLLDHDGRDDFAGVNAGGIETWSALGTAVGLSREDLWTFRHVQPGVRFAVDAYVNFARRAPWQEAIISSLTEMFAPKIHADRLAGWPSHYPWIDASGLGYFRSRIPLAQRDVEHGLEVALAYGDTRAKQQRAVAILGFKLDVLWSLLDAVDRAYPDDLAPELRP
ncbi:pyrroloquinoline-quinone synthase PqqC [Rivibacter subsaxonicus]|uniref:Pyrroloquinoline-quinone synthase n=1 Tax=Rivibacter subsaxonicus TaxID=457575 RepID=A0A4Q7VNE8_9BURK|nr:pyrroloquinoline-quinone synthase PqqC [Rivibacter subsaxonicus]RZT97873.1 pyrroloquinoline-quinone synthase [Rivibacter subsaxonicus]